MTAQRHVLPAVLFLLASTAAQVITPSEDVCLQALGSVNATVLMVAVAYGKHPEDAFYLNSLQNVNDIPSDETVCAYKRTGTLLGQPVMIAATNEGYFSAGLCTFEILQCAPYIKEIIWSGTAGVSPQKGGILDPNNCNAPVQGSEPVTRIGDICVTPFSVEFSCTGASWSQQCANYPSVCTEPEFQSGYGTPIESGNPQCVWDTKQSADFSLVNEVMEAQNTVEALAAFPARPAAISTFESQYWANMTIGTGVNYSYDPSTPPRIYDPTECMEASSLSYWTGTPYDYAMRQYVALAINDGLGLNLSALDTVGFTAEEATGFTAAIYKYQAVKNITVPFVIIRGASDYSHPPVYQANGAWLEMDDTDLNTSNSFAQTVASYSAVIFNLFRARCNSQGLSNCAVPSLSAVLPAAVLKSYASA